MRKQVSVVSQSTYAYRNQLFYCQSQTHAQRPGQAAKTEKRSDVNLATRFVYDACKNKYDYAVIISRDTDFCGMIEFVSDKFTKKIIDVWTVDEMTEELNEIIEDNKRVKHHRITNDDLIKLTQIANFSFDPSSVENMP